jgi:TetR/AcrR family transcriptional regulator, mexJK operon transcriptional repressor
VPASRTDAYLDAAMVLFDRHGFAGTSTDMIVAEVGGSKATLYKYFPAKDDLLRGLMHRAVTTVTAELADPVANTEPLSDALRSIGRAACAGVWSPGAIAVLRLCLAEVGRAPDLVRDIWEHGPARTYAHFHDFVAERERRGELRVEDPQIAAEQFIGGLVAHVQLKLAFGIAPAPSPADTNARIDSAVTTFLARYATAEPASSA